MSNLLVVLYIIYVQRQFEKNQSEAYAQFMEQKDIKSERLSHELARIMRLRCDEFKSQRSKAIEEM